MLVEEINQAIEKLPEELLKEIYDFVLFLKQKKSLEKIETHFASEDVLAKEWSTPEEDEAWKDL